MVEAERNFQKLGKAPAFRLLDTLCTITKANLEGHSLAADPHTGKQKKFSGEDDSTWEATIRYDFEDISGLLVYISNRRFPESDSDTLIREGAEELLRVIDKKPAPETT